MRKAFVVAVLAAVLPATVAAQVYVHPDPAHALVVGPVLRGPSPWPWLDATEPAVADVLAPHMQTPPTMIAGPGTLAATAPPNVIDAGNGFLTTAPGQSGILWRGVGTNFTQADVGTRIAIAWDPDGNGTNQGRRVVYINAVRGPTEIVASDYYMTEPATAFAVPRSWGYLGVSYYPWDANHPASQNVMFYEAGLAAARLYARSQLAKHQAQFHALCTTWWRWSLGSGYGVPIPRNAGLHAMLACATDPNYAAKPPGLLAGIARQTQNIAPRLTTAAGNEPGYNPTSAVKKASFDVRELSYVLRYTALLARLIPAGQQAEWCGYLANQVTHVWLAGATAVDADHAYWEEDLFAMNPGYIAASSPAADPKGAFGTSPWRATGLPIIALGYAYEALADPATCNNPTLAAQLFTPTGGLIQRAANFLWDYGRSPDGGVFYNVGYESDTGNKVNGTVISNVPGVTAMVTNGSTQVVGTGTAFTTLFATALGPTYVGFLGPEPDRKVYRVASVEDDTHLTLTLPYAGQNATASFFGRAIQADTDCGPRSITKWCEKDRWSGRNLAADTGYGYAWLHSKTKAAVWKARAEYFGNKTLGGPSTGAGSTGAPSGTCVGDEASECADGKTGNLAEVLPPCPWGVPTPPPCGGNEVLTKYGKPWGMHAGAGNIPTMIALLVGTGPTPPPQCSPASMGFIVRGWPGTGGRKRLDYQSNADVKVTFDPFTKPMTATATNAAGDCVVTVRRP